MLMLDWIIFGPARLLAVWPYAGVWIAVVLLAMQAWFSWRRGVLFERQYFREAPVLGGLLWLIFNLYELQLAATLLKGQGANTVRMDLVFLVPILYVMTLAAVWAIVSQLRGVLPARERATPTNED